MALVVVLPAPGQAELDQRGLPDLRIVGSMHERKALMAELSDAFIALPGGIGEPAAAIRHTDGAAYRTEVTGYDALGIRYIERRLPFRAGKRGAYRKRVAQVEYST